MALSLEAARRWTKSHPLLKRLPFLIIAGVGIWVWRGASGTFPTTRELIWQLPGDLHSIRQVEIQVWEEQTLLKRESLHFPTGVSQDIVQKLPLKPGDYQARLFIQRTARPGVESLSRPLRVGDEEILVTTLR